MFTRRRHRRAIERDLARLADGTLAPGRRERLERTVAASYELQVADSSTFEPPLVIDLMLTSNEFDTSKLPVGVLFWRVRALDSNSTPGAWSVVSQLTVTSA